MKKKILMPIFLFSLAGTALAYNLLQPLPGVGQTVDTFPNYIAGIIPFILGLAAVLAVVEIVIGGIEYAVTEAIDSKADAKDRITQAILGLLLALASWLILWTINPALVNLHLTIPELILPTQDQTQQQTGPPWTDQEKQVQLSTRPGGTVTCFTYNPAINRRGVRTFGDSSKTIDQLNAQCQQQCVQAAQTTGTQAECVASTNPINTSPIVLPSQAHCTVTGQCSVIGTGNSCTNASECTVTTAPPGQKTYCILDAGNQPPNCTLHQEIEQSSCSQASCQVATPLGNACPNATAICVIK
ncbi:MAG: hypothetical protein Q8Q46_02110 [Candidatus Giovannonibacteria bacterium]|nr:hypothetical protein [Candidatus Giovannonibacteria bacterium]